MKLQRKSRLRLRLRRWVPIIAFSLLILLFFFIVACHHFCQKKSTSMSYPTGIPASAHAATPAFIPPFLESKENLEYSLEYKDLQLYYNYSERTMPCNDDVKLLIMIPSRPNTPGNRHAIRHSWLKNTDPSIAHRFVIGFTEDERIQNHTKNEALKYNDLIITNVHDSYKNLTLKANIMFQWQQTYCKGVKYLLKTDDDTIVDLQRLQYLIETKYDQISEKLNNTVIFGRMWSNANATVSRDIDNKWYIPPSAWSKPFFPDYCNGASCLFTPNAVKLLLKETPNHFHITVDDAFFGGIVAEAAGISRIDQKGNFKFGSDVETYEKCDENGIPHTTFIFFEKKYPEDRLEELYVKTYEKIQNIQCADNWFYLNVLNGLCGLKNCISS